MKILVFSPIELPYTVGACYTGLERLAVQFAEEWYKLGHEVTILAHKDTDVKSGIELLGCEGYEVIQRPQHAEAIAFQRYISEFSKYDVIWDIGHLHLVARYLPFLPTCNVFSANPQYEALKNNIKAPYNLISWSKWGVGQIRRWYKQESKYQETIMVDPDVYKPKTYLVGADPAITQAYNQEYIPPTSQEFPRSERFLTMGRMSHEKGNLNAVGLCQELDLPLDVAGGRGSEVTAGQPMSSYEAQIVEYCDGKKIVFHGEVSDEEKITLMQKAKGLIYMTSHVEITSHKVQEAILCGCPAIIPNLGGLPEIVTDGVDGMLCNDLNDYRNAIARIDELDPSKTREEMAVKYHPVKVAQGYIDLFEGVADGLRWK